MRPLVAIVALSLLAGCGSDRTETGSSSAHGVTIDRYEIHSRYVDGPQRQILATPPGGGSGRPLLVYLHGRGPRKEEGDANDAFFAALSALGERGPSVVFPAGDDAYWHDRDGGRWTDYVLHEVIPQAIRRLDADPDRVAIGGTSMGGFGAFDVARHAPGRFCAVGGHAAAIWRTGAETAPGAFDDAEDFARHDLVGLARAQGRAPWGGARLWLDGGADDPFRPGGTALAEALGITMRISPGGHERAYWYAHYGDYLAFYSAALAAC